jgi:predicted HNH restriction endonuclease
MPYKDKDKQIAAQKRYYEQNKPVYAQQQRDRRQKTRKYIIEIKSAAVCADCLIDYPHYVLQFDHITDDKVMDVGKLAKEGNMAKLLVEIAKCEIVCANCHMHRTWMRSAAQPRK